MGLCEVTSRSRSAAAEAEARPSSALRKAIVRPRWKSCDTSSGLGFISKRRAERRDICGTMGFMRKRCSRSWRVAHIS